MASAVYSNIKLYFKLNLTEWKAGGISTLLLYRFETNRGKFRGEKEEEEEEAEKAYLLDANDSVSLHMVSRRSTRSGRGKWRGLI